MYVNTRCCVFIGVTDLSKIGRRYAGFFDKLSETMKTLAENLGYLARYERLYRDNVDFRAVSTAIGRVASLLTLPRLCARRTGILSHSARLCVGYLWMKMER